MYFLYLSENDPTLLLSVLGMSGAQLTKVEAEVRNRFLDNLAVALVPALFRIRDILVRIWILGSVLLANGSGSGNFRQCPSKVADKKS
jgi:hypothetical protein